MTSDTQTITGAGLGLRRGLLEEWHQLEEKQPELLPDFIEITPDNWMGLGGRYAREMRHFTDRYPALSHGLSLSLGGPDPLDTKFIDRLGHFLDEHNIASFSEHLSYCTDGGHLYDLLPLPFTGEAVEHVSSRIRAVQKQLGRRIAIENVSFYAAPEGEMSEIDFLNTVLSEADCDLLLDVNNVYVNSHNHSYDAHDFISAVPTERISWLHMAGHLREAPDLIIDTHGDSVVDPVWDLLQFTYSCHGVQPTLLERDFNLPPMHELIDELAIIRQYQQGVSSDAA
jgi:uncharacterized protein (UPF0276 family)